jgi:chemotaxis protein CheC
LAEIGNMTLSYFLNATATLADAPELLQPSPPGVMVDMLGAILDVVVTSVGAVRDDMLIVDTGFGDAAGNVQGHFWVLPDPTIRDFG